MTDCKEIPVHTSVVMLEIAKRPCSFGQLQDWHKLSPSTLSRILKFLRSSGFIEVVIIAHDKRDGMRKAYTVTVNGKKMVPLFKTLDDTEREILERMRE